jgi:hypothetical protein
MTTTHTRREVAGMIRKADRVSVAVYLERGGKAPAWIDVSKAQARRMVWRNRGRIEATLDDVCGVRELMIGAFGLLV